MIAIFGIKENEKNAMRNEAGASNGWFETKLAIEVDRAKDCEWLKASTLIS